MIRYSTNTTVGVTEKFKDDTVSALGYIKSKYEDSTPSMIDFINVLQVEVHSKIERNQMDELLNSLYPDLTETLGDCDKIGLMLKIGQNNIKSLIYREDAFDDVKLAILEKYDSLIETQSLKKIEKPDTSQIPTTM